MAKILLLGGTGAMGVYLRQELATQGHEVVVTSRSTRPPEPSVRFIRGNGKDTDFLRRILDAERPDVVVDFLIYSTEQFLERRDLFLTQVKQYVFLSSYRVFNETVPLTETSPRLLDTINDPEYLRTDEYALCKARCENLLRESGKSNWTIVRPGITYSKGRFQFGCLEANTVCYRALRGLPVIMPREMLLKRTTMSWGGDVAKMISRLILNVKAFGESFNTVTSENHTWQEVANFYAEIIGLRVVPVSMTDYLSVCGQYQVRYDRMFDRVMDNRKVLSVTGIRQRDLTPLRDGLLRELNGNLQDLGKIVPNVGQNARIDRICNVIKVPQGGFAVKTAYLSVRFKTFAGCGQIIRRVKRIFFR